ncbi:hypothetical protein L6164_026943 [Bauhinia variegata]|uniref:Uncharacterized protein n=1 Tax=Bauhinia variegata TaxID=167791 RepID=A0ACB9LT56_BAUVA|nr:hypothetical protein L6164_026943 [Bauhinia variegata]
MTHPGHGAGELGGGDVAVAIPVEGPEYLQELFLVDEHLFIHVRQNGMHELLKLNVAIAILVHVGEQGVELIAVRRFDAEGPEEGGEL